MGKSETEVAASSRTSCGDGEVLPASLPPSDEKHLGADVALGFIEQHAGFEYTPEQERALVRKIDLWLMPLMFVSYVIQYMDKSVMSQAAIYDLQTNLHLVGQDYSWCSSIFYFGYLVAQPVAAYFLTFFPIGKFVSATSLFWAVVLFATAGCKNFAGMATARFFLGVAEAGISPAYVLITGAWYKQDEIPFRMGIWFCGNGVAILIQSVLSYGIGHIDDTALAIWQWFFIIFGIIGLFWAGVLYRFMPDSVLTAKFLTEDERVIAVERLRRNRTGVASAKFKKDQFIEAITDVKVWWGFFYTIVWIIPCSTVASFGSIVIKSFGYNSFQSSLLNMPLGATEIIGLLGAGYVAGRWPNMRCVMQVVCCAPALIGSALVKALPKSNHVGRLVSFHITNFTIGCITMLWAMTNSNIAGHTKRATSNAILFIGYATGFIVGPQFFITKEAPGYRTGFLAMVILNAFATAMPIFYWLYITWENRRRAARLAASGEGNVAVLNEEFLDLTDKQQIRFVYIK